MDAFIALYKGRTVGEAAIVAVSADRELVAQVAQAILESRQPVAEIVENRGRRRVAVKRPSRKQGRASA